MSIKEITSFWRPNYPVFFDSSPDKTRIFIPGFSSLETDKLGNTEKKRTISVVNVDFTASDSLISEESGIYRKMLKQILKKDISNKDNVLAAFLIHNKSQDNQPFFATHSVLFDDEIVGVHVEETALLMNQQICLEKFDSLARLYQNRNQLTQAATSLIQHTNIFGGIQNAVLYFRKHADKETQKQLYFYLI